MIDILKLHAQQDLKYQNLQVLLLFKFKVIEGRLTSKSWEQGLTDSVFMVDKSRDWHAATKLEAVRTVFV